MPTGAGERPSLSSVGTTQRSARIASFARSASRSGGRSATTTCSLPAIESSWPSRAARTPSPCGTCCRPRLRRHGPLPRARASTTTRERSGRVAHGVRRGAGRRAHPRGPAGRRTGSTSRPRAAGVRGPRARSAASPSATLFNRAALEGGFDVVATGHNLDDEAATLLGNTLRWQTELIARQHPSLPAR